MRGFPFAALLGEIVGDGFEVTQRTCHIAEINDAPDALDGVKSYALDAGNAERLWELSEKLVGERFELRA